MTVLRAYGKLCKSGYFWRFQASRSFVLPVRRGSLWHVGVFGNLSKIFFRGRRNTFATLSEDVCHGRCSTLDVSVFIFRGRRSTSDVSCCMFSANRIVRAARSGDRVQMPWKKNAMRRIRNIDFEVANFEVLLKTPGKTSILTLQVVKLGGSLARIARFDAPTCLV